MLMRWEKLEAWAVVLLSPLRGRVCELEAVLVCCWSTLVVDEDAFVANFSVSLGLADTALAGTAALVGVWEVGCVPCRREDLRAGKAAVYCMAKVSDPLLLCCFRAAGERSGCCSCGRIRLAICVSAVGDLGDATSCLGFSGSFQLSRLGNGGSSLLRLTAFDSDFLGCAPSSPWPWEDPDLFSLLVLFIRRRPQLRQVAFEPLRERPVSLLSAGERRDSLDCARLRARLRDPGKTYSMTLSLILVARLGGRTDVEGRRWRSAVSCWRFLSISRRIHSDAWASAAATGSSKL